MQQSGDLDAAGLFSFGCLAGPGDVGLGDEGTAKKMADTLLSRS